MLRLLPSAAISLPVIRRRPVFARASPPNGTSGSSSTTSIAESVEVARESGPAHPVDPTTSPRSPAIASTGQAATPTFSSPIAHPGIFVLGLAIYSAVSIDVFDPHSLHLLQPLDTGLHQFVLSNIDPVLRKSLFGTVFSNSWLLMASLGWVFATATALSRNNPLGWQAVALGWFLWIHFVGPVEHDPTLMDALKHSFARVRPSPIHSSASFPSGHTAADVMCVGSLLFVLLPTVYGSRPRASGEAGSSSSGSGSGGFARGLVDVIYWAQENSWALLALSVVTTIVGRVGVDAHWLSDTLAGGGLSLALVSGLASATQQLAVRRAGPEGGADEAL